MTRRALGVLLGLLGLAAAAAPARAGVYGIGVNGEYGNAYLPPTGGAMLSTSLHYEEYGGILLKLLLLASAPVKPEGSTTTSQEPFCLGQGSDRTCTTVVVTTTTTPTAAELEDYERRLSAWDPAIAQSIMRGESGLELDLDIPMRSLGGDTSGFMAHVWYPIGWDGRLSVGAAAFGWVTFHGVKSKEVQADPTEVRAVDKMSDVTYKYAGLPLRVQTAIGRSGLGAHVQLDLNILSLVLDQPSPIRAGLSWAGYHVLAKLEGVVTGYRPDGASVSAQVQLGF